MLRNTLQEAPGEICLCCEHLTLKVRKIFNSATIRREEKCSWQIFSSSLTPSPQQTAESVSPCTTETQGEQVTMCRTVLRFMLCHSSREDFINSAICPRYHPPQRSTAGAPAASEEDGYLKYKKNCASSLKNCLPPAAEGIAVPKSVLLILSVVCHLHPGWLAPCPLIFHLHSRHPTSPYHNKWLPGPLMVIPCHTSALAPFMGEQLTQNTTDSIRRADDLLTCQRKSSSRKHKYCSLLINVWIVPF